MMSLKKLPLYSTILVVLLPLAIYAQEPGPATLMPGLGSYSHKISSTNPQTQKFFDQGLTLSYAFNHAEAERSFREAARLDPNCAMCYWGIALVLGPNINMAMDSEAVPPAYIAIKKAISLMKYASQKEQDYIKTLATRYGAEPVEDRTPLNEAYANAMRELSKKYPEDLDAATLFAEALMDVHPWDYYKKDATRAPQPWTAEIVNTLESVMKRNPDHPGANHLFIHAVEASNNPEKGLPMAERLTRLVPAAGHLVHMPAHIYIRTGNYRQASAANEKAIQSDNEYLAGCHAPGPYSAAYVPHNHHFLSSTATLEGNYKLAMQAANNTSSKVDPKLVREKGYGVLQHFSMIPTYVRIRFGKWDEILNSPAPDKDLVYPTGVWHYARGIAFIRTGKLQNAKKELDAVNTVTANPVLKEVTLFDINSTESLMQIAREHLAGEVAAASGNYDEAIKHLKAAVQIEDNLTYDEPPPWNNPTRHYLGAILLQAKRPAEAEKVYRDELNKFPKNGWSLTGLMQSLEAQGKKEETAQVKVELDKAWAGADVKLTASRM
jgi:tetratricopeptide (TPR) repeat protein